MLDCGRWFHGLQTGICLQGPSSVRFSSLSVSPLRIIDHLIALAILLKQGVKRGHFALTSVKSFLQVFLEIPLTVASLSSWDGVLCQLVVAGKLNVRVISSPNEYSGTLADLFVPATLDLPFEGSFHLDSVGQHQNHDPHQPLGSNQKCQCSEGERTLAWTNSCSSPVSHMQSDFSSPRDQCNCY